MTEQEVIEHVTRLRARVQELAKAYPNDRLNISELMGASGPKSPAGIQAEVVEFLRLAAGPRSEFSNKAREARGDARIILRGLDSVLASFVEHVRSGLQAAISPRREVQLEVVSDFLDQAQSLLETRGMHPAAPIVLIGATLEEYLRTTVEKEGLSIGNRKPGLQAYTDALRDADLLSKQDVKDITSWAGMRNHAAHGNWDQVKDPERARLMLQGVNLFLRQRGGG